MSMTDARAGGIAIAEALDGKSVDWMEHVTDEQYRAGEGAV